MPKTDIPLEQARIVIDRVAKELGLLVADTSGWIKIQSPMTKHRLYCQLSKNLNRIDTTMERLNSEGVAAPGTLEMKNPNGSIKCHLEPTLENLEFHLRRLSDSSNGVQVPNKPRPFAPSKAPAVRKPTPVVAPIPAEALVDVPRVDGEDLKVRVAKIREASRKARVKRYMENDGLTHEEATGVVDGSLSLADIREAHANERGAELSDIASEAGVELTS